MCAQLGERPGREDAAVVHDREAVAQRPALPPCSGRCRGRRCPPPPARARGRAAARGSAGPPPTGGLVEQQDARPVDDAAAEVQAALHAAACNRLTGSRARSSSPVSSSTSPTRPLQRRPPQAVGGAPVAEVVGRAQVLVEGQLLRHHPDARPRRAPVEHHVVPEHADAAGRRRQQARDAADGRRLARPVGPEQPEDAASRRRRS